MTEPAEDQDNSGMPPYTEAFTREEVLFCPSCRANFPPSEENFAIYLSRSASLCCPGCEVQIDWWEIVVDALAEGFLGLQYAPVRSQSTHTTVVMKRNELTTIDPTDLGIPATAQVLYMNYTGAMGKPDDADGTFKPLEVHQNPSEHYALADRPLLLYPMPLGDSPPNEQQIFVLIVWVDMADLDVSESSLIAAVEAFNEGKYPDAIVSAAAAVEAAVEPVLSTFLQEFADPKKTTALLHSAGATGQQEVLLPTICRIVEAPTLPDPPATALRGLRKLRNRAAHRRHLSPATGPRKIAEAVAGAVFAVDHARLARQAVDEYLD